MKTVLIVLEIISVSVDVTLSLGTGSEITSFWEKEELQRQVNGIIVEQLLLEFLFIVLPATRDEDQTYVLCQHT